jgi:hypothetical protein
MFRKELKLIQKDVFALLLVFALPIMVMGTMYFAINQGSIGTAIDSSGKNEGAITIGVVDVDNTDTYPREDLSANFTLYLSRSPDLIVLIYENEADALNALYQDIVKAYCVIPYGFEGNITGDIPALIDIHISSTDFEIQASIYGTFSDVANDFRYDHGWVKGEIALDRVREFAPVGNSTAATF